MSAFWALGTLPSVASSTCCPVTPSSFSFLPAIDSFLILLPLIFEAA